MYTCVYIKAVKKKRGYCSDALHGWCFSRFHDLHQNPKKKNPKP